MEKTMADVEMLALEGPFYNLEQLDSNARPLNHQWAPFPGNPPVENMSIVCSLINYIFFYKNFSLNLLTTMHRDNSQHLQARSPIRHLGDAWRSERGIGEEHR